MPTARRERFGEYARKGFELGLRSVASAPEQRAARRLALTDSRACDTPAHDGPNVLFLTPRDWAAHVQYEAMMGHALRRRGANVRFLTCGGGLEICDRANTHEAPPMPCRSCSRYVEDSLTAHGHRVERLRTGWETTADDDWPELDLIERSELESVVVDGIRLGALVAIPVRWFLCAADVDDDPLAAVITRAFLRSARRIMRAAAASLDAERPDVVVLLNGLFLFESIVWELCREREIDVVTYERAFVHETLVFGHGAPAGYYNFSDKYMIEQRPLDRVETAQLDGYLEQRSIGGGADQFWQFAERTWTSDGGRLVALFTNLTWDTAVLDRDLAFPNIHAWLDAAVEHFCDRPADRLVIRVHPSELHLPGKRTRDSLEAYLARRFPTLPSNVSVIGPADSSSSYPLMQAADVGLVYTSTTGLELGLRGTPVIVAGETHYRDKGFSIDVTNPEEFHAALDKALADPDAAHTDVTAAREYAHFFFFRAPIATPGVREPLPGLARLDISDLRELDPGVNRAVDRICDEILGCRAPVAATEEAL